MISPRNPGDLGRRARVRLTTVRERATLRSLFKVLIADSTRLGLLDQALKVTQVTLERVLRDETLFVFSCYSTVEVKKLSPREREIANLVLDGMTDKEIARAIGINRSTVSGHVQSAHKKLGIHKRVELARFAQAISMLTALDDNQHDSNP